MKGVTWLLIGSLLFVPTTQAFDQHPLKLWLQKHAAEHKTIDGDESATSPVSEKKAASEAKKKAIRGAILGGLVAGARAAILHQDVAKAIAAGAAAGAIAGYVIGKMQDRRIADRDALAQRIDYDPAQGVQARVTSLSCDPCRVKPGQKFNLTVSYWAMSPERTPLSLRRHLGLAVGGSYIHAFTFDPDPFTIENGGGEYETTLEYSIGKEGTYTFDWLVENDDAAIQQAGTANIIVTNAA